MKSKHFATYGKKTAYRSFRYRPRDDNATNKSTITAHLLWSVIVKII